MVSGNGNVKIMDFGLAKITGRKEITGTAMTGGTAAYMSPEQGRGETVDHRTDIWSLGIVMYEMFSGRLPFTGGFESVVSDDPVPLGRLRPDVPLEVKRVIEQAMARDVAGRYQTITEMLAHLQAPDGVSPIPSARKPQKRSIAVLPFVDLSPEKDQDYFCDGIAEEIITALTKVEGLRVVSRTSSFAFKGKSLDVREIGKTLDVETVMEGSVRKDGTKVRITGQLISVSDGFHLWSDQYDRELEDIFAIQDEIAQSIVGALSVTLTPREKRAIERAPTKNVEAYDYYLRGRKFFYQSKRTGIEFAREMFTKAIKKDSNYPLAYAGLSECHSYLSLYFGGGDEHKTKAQEAGQKALELDPNLAEAHAARGLAMSLSERYDEAEREFETAIRLDPKLFEAYYYFARVCFAQGKMEKAIDMYHRAGEVNPDDYQAPSLEAFTYRTLNRMEESKEAYRRSLEVIEKHIELNPDDSRAIFLGATALIDLDQTERALSWVKKAQTIDPDDALLLYGVACFYARMDDADEAIRYFEKAIAAGITHRDWVEHDSDLDPIRDDPRFKALLEKME
jgi:TolB-like protein/Flp pilus assembly protein TadD